MPCASGWQNWHRGRGDCLAFSRTRSNPAWHDVRVTYTTWVVTETPYNLIQSRIPHIRVMHKLFEQFTHAMLLD